MRALLLAVALSWSAHSQQESTTPANRAQGAQGQERGSDALPVSVKLMNTGKTEVEAQQETERVEQDRLLSKRTYYANLALVAATIVTLGVLLFQGFWLRRDVVQSEQHTRIQLRAYVRVARIVLNQAETQVSFDNAGSTPAREIRQQMRIYRGPKSWFKQKVWLLTDAAETTLGQGASYFYVQGVPALTPEEIAQIAKGDPDWVYVIGRIEYVDVFGKRCHTDFGFDQEFSKLGPRGGESTVSITPGLNHQS